MIHVELIRDTVILMLQDLTISPSVLIDAMAHLSTLMNYRVCEHNRPCSYEPELSNLAAVTGIAVTALPADPQEHVNTEETSTVAVSLSPPHSSGSESPGYA